MKKVLITGATGFVGSRLCKMYLDTTDYEVHAIKRWRSPMDLITYYKLEDTVKWHECDLTDAHSTQKVIKEVRPDVIHHIAAQSFVPDR